MFINYQGLLIFSKFEFNLFFNLILNSCRDELLSQLFENCGNYLKIVAILLYYYYILSKSEFSVSLIEDIMNFKIILF